MGHDHDPDTEQRLLRRREEDARLIEAVSRKKRWDRLVMPSLLLGLALMAVAAVISVGSLKSWNERRLADENSCLVANSVIREVDRTNGLIYVLFYRVQLSSEDQRDPDAKKRVAAYEAFAREVKHLPRIDCKKEVADPSRNQIPRPVPYNDYLKRGGKPPVDLPRSP